MSRTHVPAERRRLVVERAAGRCEFCGIPEAVCFAPHEVDHVVAEQHGGPTSIDNLALACILCNRRKGTNLASIDPQTGEITRLFNPRSDVPIKVERNSFRSPPVIDAVRSPSLGPGRRVRERNEFRSTFPPVRGILAARLGGRNLRPQTIRLCGRSRRQPQPLRTQRTRESERRRYKRTDPPPARSRPPFPR
jgi:hypothetical protein